MSDPKEILERLAFTACSDYGAKGLTPTKDSDLINQAFEKLEAHYKDKIRAAIGEDEAPDTGGSVQVMALYNARNQLRAELRKKLEL